MVTHATRVRRYKHLIGGEWLDPSSGEVIPRDNPATGEKVAEFAAGNPDDTRRAIAAARVAFDRGPWPRMSGMERSKLLYELARRISEEAESLARIEVEEVGKTIRFARGDVGGRSGSSSTLRDSRRRCMARCTVTWARTTTGWWCASPLGSSA